MIINPYIFSAAIDSDAQAFLTAASITDVTIKSAINTLVLDLKANNLWTKCYAIYPFVGGTSATHKFNLKNPLDTDAAYRLVFNGGWTHSATGIFGNGVNSYADTKFPMNGLPQNDSHLSIYCRTNTTTNVIDYGVQYTSVSYSSFISCKLSSNFNSRLNTSGFSDGLTANTDSRGHFLSYRDNSANITTRKNLNTANTFTQASTTAGANTLPVFLGNLNFNGTPLGGYYSNREYCFATLGTALTAGESTTFYNIIQTFQTTLGRSIGTQTVSDSDAQAFVTAAVIEDQVQANAINTLVSNLKANNLWTKMKAVYPFIGGTATSHKWNLKNPLDTDAAFRLIFNGGWTHSNTGATPNGTNAYADTKFNPNTHLTNASAHFAKYNRTLDITGNKVEGALDAGNSSYFQQNYATANGLIGEVGAVASYTPTDSRGLFTVSRIATNAQKVFRNTTEVAVNNTTITNIPNKFVYLGARNDASPAGYNLYEAAFASYGNGLTDTDISNLYTIIQAYQTTLARQV